MEGRPHVGVGEDGVADDREEVLCAAPLHLLFLALGMGMGLMCSEGPLFGGGAWTV